MTKNAEIGWIDGLKGISILGIILTHYPHLDYEFMDVIACSGARCVQFFFVISSFLIFQSLYRKFGDNNISFFEGSKWFIRRLILLMPMYYLAIIIGLLVNEHGIRYYLGSIDNVSVINIISHFLFLHGFSPYYVNSIIGVEWYVGVLVMIYILAPYMFNKIKTLKKAVSVCIISFIICRCAQSLLCSLNYLPDDYLFNIYFTNFSILGQFPIVMLGVIFYFLYKDKMCKVTTKSACIFGGVALLIIIFLMKKNSGIFIYWGIACVFLMISCNNIKNIVVENKIFKILGRYSYGIYLFHYFILSYISQIQFYLDNVFINYVCGYIVTIIVSFIVSFVLKKYFELNIARELLSRL